MTDAVFAPGFLECEIIAWLVGWALILEYALGASAVAVGWSGFITGLLDSVGVHLPHALKVGPQIQWGFLQGGEVGGFFNLPAVLVVAFVTTPPLLARVLRFGK